MNYCIYLKKRKNKPFCKLLNREITFSCCRECDKKEYKKKKHNKRITVTQDTYNKVIKRDNYRCMLCNNINDLPEKNIKAFYRSKATLLKKMSVTNDILELHHILYRSERKDLINDVNNCIMLCSDCHRLVHKNKKLWQPVLLELNKKRSF